MLTGIEFTILGGGCVQTGIEIYPASRAMPIRKRWRAIQVGRDYYLHKKTYRRLVRQSRRGADLRSLLERIKTTHRIPSFDLNPFGRFSGFGGIR